MKKNDRLLRDTEVAEVYGISRRMVWSLAAAGKLPTVKLGKRCTRFRESDVQALIAKGL